MLFIRYANRIWIDWAYLCTRFRTLAHYRCLSKQSVTLEIKLERKKEIELRIYTLVFQCLILFFFLSLYGRHSQV